jgi:hypothetical protein
MTGVGRARNAVLLLSRCLLVIHGCAGGQLPLTVHNCRAFTRIGHVRHKCPYGSTMIVADTHSRAASNTFLAETGLSCSCLKIRTQGCTDPPVKTRRPGKMSFN